MGTRHTFFVEPDFVPQVVIDSQAGSAYVRFGEGRVAYTTNWQEGDTIVNIDHDAGDRIIGLEVTGVQKFNLRDLLEVAGLREYFSQEIIDRAVYTRTDTAPVVEPVLADGPE